MAGTEGQYKRLEAIRIQLTGADADKYDIYYRVHAQTYGWLDWAKNGETAGTTGYGKRLEAIEIVVVEKGEDAPGSTNRPCIEKPGDLSYRTHVQTFGWQDFVTDGALSGTEGLAKRLEAIEIKLDNANVSGNISYRTHCTDFRLARLGEQRDNEWNRRTGRTYGGNRDQTGRRSGPEL